MGQVAFFHFEEPEIDRRAEKVASASRPVAPAAVLSPSSRPRRQRTSELKVSCGAEHDRPDDELGL